VVPEPLPADAERRDDPESSDSDANHRQVYSSGQLSFKFRTVIAWAGGALFVVSLAYFLYFYTVVLGRSGLTRAAWPYAFGFDVALFSVFALHHSVMARSGAKAALTRLMPVALERSFYVWIASALLLVTCWFWQPIGGTLYEQDGLWRVAHVAVQTIGLWIIARATRSLDPLDLAGIRQIDKNPGTSEPRNPGTLSSDGPYGLVRHPIYFGWLLLTFGVATMTVDRLVFATISAVYLLMAIPFEERSLIDAFGEDYRAYRLAVRWRIVPYVW